MSGGNTEPTQQTQPDRVLSALINRLLADGLTVEELAKALALPTAKVRQARYWRPAGKFTAPERQRYRDLLRLAAWRLPYWQTGPDGRLELLPANQRSTRRIEVAASYPGRVAQGNPPSLQGVPDGPGGTDRRP